MMMLPVSYATAKLTPSSSGQIDAAFMAVGGGLPLAMHTHPIRTLVTNKCNGFLSSPLPSRGSSSNRSASDLFDCLKRTQRSTRAAASYRHMARSVNGGKDMSALRHMETK
jgi:hypothetical protein